MTLRIHQDTNPESDCKSQLKFLAGNATTRNMVDLLLVITILVLLGVAAPVVRGDSCGKFLFWTMRCCEINGTSKNAQISSSGDIVQGTLQLNLIIILLKWKCIQDKNYTAVASRLRKRSFFV